MKDNTVTEQDSLFNDDLKRVQQDDEAEEQDEDQKVNEVFNVLQAQKGPSSAGDI